MLRHVASPGPCTVVPDHQGLEGPLSLEETGHLMGPGGDAGRLRDEGSPADLEAGRGDAAAPGRGPTGGRGGGQGPTGGRGGGQGPTGGRGGGQGPTGGLGCGQGPTGGRGGGSRRHDPLKNFRRHTLRNLQPAARGNQLGRVRGRHPQPSHAVVNHKTINQYTRRRRPSVRGSIHALPLELRLE